MFLKEHQTTNVPRGTHDFTFDFLKGFIYY
jgi:hypothetical protein